MLEPAALTEALQDALKAAVPPCGRFCTSGISIDDGRYIAFHNGTGRRDTDVQVIHAGTILAMTKATLSGRLRAWLESVHRGERLDLNAS